MGAVLSPVHVAPIADLDDEHDEALSVHLVQDAVVTDADAVRAFVGALQWLGARRERVHRQHWDRLIGGALYAVSTRVDWASLLRRSLDVDVLQCPKCHGRLRVLAVITEREPVRRILAHLGVPTDAPPVARARDPTDDYPDDVESPGQLVLGLA
jgi:hypothetical protein